MDTKVYYLDENETEKIIEAAEVIKGGGLVVFPTETVYGLGANALSGEACSKIFTAKGRPQDNPLIIHVADFDISKYVSEVPQTAEKLMEAFWPGPLTIIMKKSDLIPDVVTAGLDSVAVRMPSNRVARRLIELSGVPVAAPSANISGRPSPTSIEHCMEDLTGRVDMIIGGERSEVGLESTVVDTTGEVVTILRPGAITLEMLEDALGEVEIDPAIMGTVKDDVKPKAPGMKYRHYAPKSPMAIVRGERHKVVDYINRRTGEMRAEGKRAGVMSVEESFEFYSSEIKISVGSEKYPGIIAANLFDSLREFDKIGVDYILAEGFPEAGLGLAIMNRLKKAAGYNVIDL